MDDDELDDELDDEDDEDDEDDAGSAPSWGIKNGAFLLLAHLSGWTIDSAEREKQLGRQRQIEG